MALDKLKYQYTDPLQVSSLSVNNNLSVGGSLSVNGTLINLVNYLTTSTSQSVQAFNDYFLTAGPAKPISK
jgi:hypothetical protein